jgi:hypothetical protein
VLDLLIDFIASIMPCVSLEVAEVFNYIVLYGVPEYICL